MATSGEQQGAEEREAVLSRLRKRMAAAARRKDMGRYAELKAEHDRLKDEHVMASHAEVKAAMRARGAARQDRPAPAALSEAERWRRVIRRRYGSGMTAIIWRPGR